MDINIAHCLISFGLGLLFSKFVFGQIAKLVSKND
jgi:lipoprotein signal peptidase